MAIALALTCMLHLTIDCGYNFDRTEGDRHRNRHFLRD